MLYKKSLLSWCHLHALASVNHSHLPHPESIIISKASENDLTVFKNNWATLKNRTFFGDKIYINQEFFDELYIKNNAEMLTSIKAVKDQSYALKYWDRAYNFHFSKAVSTIGQPIEGFFNWLIEKTDIQRASKVRSIKGLQVHIFGKLAAAFLNIVFEHLIHIRNDNGGTGATTRFVAHTIQKYFADKKKPIVIQEFTKPATPEQNAHIESYHSITERVICQKFQFDDLI